MQLDQIFYAVGIVYFTLWLLITLACVVFGIILIVRIRKKAKQLESKLAAAKVIVDLIQSNIIRKGLVLVSGGAFAAKAISGLQSFFGSNEDKKQA